MLSGEFRYLTDGYGEGIFSSAYLPNDKEYDDEDRKAIFMIINGHQAAFHA